MVTSLRDIEIGEEITVSYLCSHDKFLQTFQQRQQVSLIYNFENKSENQLIANMQTQT